MSMVAKVAYIKQFFFKYINRAEYAMIFSSVIGSIGTMIFTGYSSYLSDKNARIARLNQTPLNHILVNYVSFEEYQRMIDKNNWKPASSRQIENSNSKKTFTEHKEEAIDLVNKWLAKKTKQQSFDEVDPESLKKLAEISKRAKLLNNNEQIDSQNKTTSNAYDYDKKTSIQDQKVPLLRSKKKTEQQKYFIVQEAGGTKRYDPRDFRKNNKKQNFNLTVESDKQSIGIIGGSNVTRDESIFQSLAHIWRILVYRDVGRNGQVINSNYDQYGNRIKKSKDEGAIRNEQISNSSDRVKEETDLLNDKLKDKQVTNVDKFLEPTFIIDGNLQQMENYNKIQKIATDDSLSAKNYQILANLEYTLEECWYKKYKDKYGNNFANATFMLSYTKDGELSNVTIGDISGIKIDEKKKIFIKDVVEMFASCNIFNSKNIAKDNYYLWGKIVVKFNSEQ